MRHPLLFNLALAAGCAMIIGTVTPAEAQRLGGGRGFHGGGGGFHGGGFAGRGFYGRPGIGRYGGAWGVPGRGFYGARRAYWGGGWGGYGYRRNYGYWPYAGAVAAPFLGGLALGGLAASYPASYGYYDYGYPYVVQSYPAPVYRRVYAAGPLGGYCQTPVTTCRLINIAEVGGGCSCRVAGGRARGVVSP